MRNPPAVSNRHTTSPLIETETEAQVRVEVRLQWNVNVKILSYNRYITGGSRPQGYERDPV